MKKSLEKRIECLESKYLPGENQIGLSMCELCFYWHFLKTWPDQDAAPKFLLAEFNRIARRSATRPSGEFFQDNGHSTDEAPHD